MKLNIKSIFLIIILLTSSQISLCKEISHATRRNKLGKAKSNKSFSSKRFFNKKTLKKSKRSKTSSKITADDWNNVDYLLPLLFLKGVCDEIEALEEIGKYIGFLVNPVGSIQDHICEQITEEVAHDTFIKDNTKFTVTINPITKLSGVESEREKIKTDIMNLFKNTGGNEKLEVTKLCSQEPKTYPIDEINSIIKEIQKSNNQEIKLTENWFSFAILDDRKEYEIKASTKFKDIKDNLPNISDESVKEIKSVHLTCLRQFFLDKILAINKAESDSKNYIKVLKDELNDDDFLIEVSSVEKSNKIDLLKKEIKNDKCIKSTERYYQKKKNDLNTMKKNTSLCPNSNKQSSLTDLVSKLFEFTLNFIKSVITCVADSLLSKLTTMLLKKIIGIVVSIIGLAGFKILWYLGKFAYFLFNTFTNNDEDTGLKNEEKKEKKREKAENYGKAVGSLYNAIMSFTGLEKRKNKRFAKKKFHKNK